MRLAAGSMSALSSSTSLNRSSRSSFDRRAFRPPTTGLVAYPRPSIESSRAAQLPHTPSCRNRRGDDTCSCTHPRRDNLPWCSSVQPALRYPCVMSVRLSTGIVGVFRVEMLAAVGAECFVSFGHPLPLADNWNDNWRIRVPLATAPPLLKPPHLRRLHFGQVAVRVLALMTQPARRASRAHSPNVSPAYWCGNSRKPCRPFWWSQYKSSV